VVHCQFMPSNQIQSTRAAQILSIVVLSFQMGIETVLKDNTNHMLCFGSVVCCIFVQHEVKFAMWREKGNICVDVGRGGGTFAGPEEPHIYPAFLLFLIIPVWCLFLSHSQIVRNESSFLEQCLLAPGSVMMMVTQKILCVTWLWCSRVGHTTQAGRVRLSSTHLVWRGAALLLPHVTLFLKNTLAACGSWRQCTFISYSAVKLWRCIII